MPRSFTFVCQLYCCSSKHSNALRITYNSCKTVSTSSMALAMVNMDKIIIVMSASSYALLTWYDVSTYNKSETNSLEVVHSSKESFRSWTQNGKRLLNRNYKYLWD